MRSLRQGRTPSRAWFGLVAVLAGLSLVAVRLPGRAFAQLPALPRGAAPPALALQRPASGAGPAAAVGGSRATVASAGVAAALMLAGAAAAAAGRARAAAKGRAAGTSVVACRATPQTIPVVDMKGEAIGSDTLHFRTFSPETANYVVHHAFMVWTYQQMPFTAWYPRRGDVKKGKKPWAQKGSGRARHGSRYSPLWGRCGTHKTPHGLDNKRKKKLGRQRHAGAISTVLQSKWRCMKIIDGIEDWSEPRQKPLEEALDLWCPGRKRATLLITRQGFGEIDKIKCTPTEESFNSPLWMSGRHIPKLTMRRPRDIDPVSDALFHCLKARRVLISKEAFADLKAKYNAEDGWAFLGKRKILVKQLQALAKEYPTDMDEEIKIARTLPRSGDEREFWAKDMRDQLALEQAS